MLVSESVQSFVGVVQGVHDFVVLMNWVLAKVYHGPGHIVCCHIEHASNRTVHMPRLLGVSGEGHGVKCIVIDSIAMGIFGVYGSGDSDCRSICGGRGITNLWGNSQARCSNSDRSCNALVGSELQRRGIFDQCSMNWLLAAVNIQAKVLLRVGVHDLRIIRWEV